jgi:hypothetical protein
LLPCKYLTLLPSGTTSNEALHAEMRAWFRQTQKLRRSTLLLKLRILLLAKIIPHNLALSRPTLRQLEPAQIAAAPMLLHYGPQRSGALSPAQMIRLSSCWRGSASMSKLALPLQPKKSLQADAQPCLVLLLSSASVRRPCGLWAKPKKQSK